MIHDRRAVIPSPPPLLGQVAHTPLRRRRAQEAHPLLTARQTAPGLIGGRGRLLPLARGPCSPRRSRILSPVTRFRGFLLSGWATPCGVAHPGGCHPRVACGNHQMGHRTSSVLACPRRRPSQPPRGRASGDASAKPENIAKSPVRMATGSALALQGVGPASRASPPDSPGRAPYPDDEGASVVSRRRLHRRSVRPSGVTHGPGPGVHVRHPCFASLDGSRALTLDLGFQEPGAPEAA